MKVICTKDEQRILSISNDGKVCHWCFENLNVPAEMYDIGINEKSIKNVYPTCIDFKKKKTIEKSYNNLRSNTINTEESEENVGLIGGDDNIINSFKQRNNK